MKYWEEGRIRLPQKMSEEDSIRLYFLYLKLHPGREFGSDVCFEVKDGKLISPNPELTKETREKFVQHILETAPMMDEILKLINYY